MNPGAPAHAKSWTRDMHTCIIVERYVDNTRQKGYRVITTTQTPSSTFAFGKLVEIGSEKHGRLGTYRVIGMVNIFTMKTLGRIFDKSLPHWILK